MNSRLFFPLLKKRAFWLSLIVLSQIGVLCWLCDFWRQESVPAEAFGLRVVLALSAGIGLLFTRIVYELLHTSVAPMLPGLRQKLVVWLACLPASVALLATALDAVWWGGVPVAPLFALTWMSAVLNLLLMRSRNEGNSQLLVVFGYGALLWRADWLLTLMRSWPWQMTLAGAGGAGICLWLGLSRAQWRQRALSPRRSLWALGDPALARQWHETQTGQTKPARPKAGPRWLEQKIDRSPWSWTRAAFYGYSGLGWKGLFILAVFMMWMVSVPFLVNSHRGDPLYILEQLLGKMGNARPAYLQSMDWMILPMVIVASSKPGRAFVLLQERIYPISRADLASITYRVCLVINVGYCAAMLLIKAALVIGLTVMVDKSPFWPPVPRFVIGGLIVATYIPLLQWFAVIFVNKQGALIAGAFLSACCISILSEAVGDLPPTVRLAVTLLLLALAAQAGLYFLLRRHFARCDLVAAPA